MKNSKNWLIFIDERLQKKHKPNLGLVRKHNTEPINKDWKIPENALWEQSDVVHDFLAFLAGQMIEMNKEKQKEIKGFLEWLEREMQAKISELSLRTKIEDYHNLDFDEFLEALKKNKKKIPVYLGNKEFQENLKTGYEKSVGKLTPLKAKIEATDKLIDQLVYMLYGLTDDEIKVIEEYDRN